MKITDLIVTAESVQDGKRLTGYVCGCKQCRTAFPDEKYGNVRVYIYTLEFVNSQ